MDNLLGTDLLAKSEMKDAIAKIRRVVRECLPSGGFAEREQAVLAMLNEAGRGVLEEELQSGLSAGFGRRRAVAAVQRVLGCR